MLERSGSFFLRDSNNMDEEKESIKIHVVLFVIL